MEYIKSLTEKDLCDFILKTKESLYICLPLLQPAVLDAIAKMPNNNNSAKVSVNIGVDFSPETFRQGYGEIKSYEKILLCDYNVLNMKDNRISFVISDNVGFYLFFESRYFIPADKETINAVQIDPISIVRLKQHFFQKCKNKSDFSNEIANAMINESIQLHAIDYPGSNSINSTKIDVENIENVLADLKQNPPLKPDYQRVVQIYKNKLQYIQLEFVGANLQSKRIALPSKALPLKNAEFKKKLESKLSLFDEKSRIDTFDLLIDFKEKLQEFRFNYTIPLKSRKENVISMLDKIEFEKELEVLQKDLKEIKQKSIKKVSAQIESTRKQLEVELDDFYYLNYENLFIQNSLFDLDEETKRSESHNSALETIYHIKWPKAHELLDGFSLKVYFSDITFEDLNNKSLLNELKEKNIINEADVKYISEINKGIEIVKEVEPK